MADKQLTEIMDMAIQFETDANEFYMTAAGIAKILPQKHYSRNWQSLS